jgi:DNA-directed RNA polymerase subunit RPC12/RpoP
MSYGYDVQAQEEADFNPEGYGVARVEYRLSCLDCGRQLVISVHPESDMAEVESRCDACYRALCERIWTKRQAASEAGVLPDDLPFE